MGDIKCGQVRKIIVLWTSINLIEVRRVQMRVNSEEWRYQEKSGPSNKDLEPEPLKTPHIAIFAAIFGRFQTRFSSNPKNILTI